VSEFKDDIVPVTNPNDQVPHDLAEFEKQYARRSGLTLDQLHNYGRYGAPCGCDAHDCQGFQMLHRDEVDHGH
jgi:hypothetical protein